MATGSVVATLKGHAEPVSSVAFSPDGKTLVSGSKDHTIKLWNVASGKNIATLKGHAGLGSIEDIGKGVVSSVAFSPDGRMLAAGIWDNTIKLWNVKMIRKAGETLRIEKKRESATPPTPREAKIEARFTATVRWIEMIGKREAEVVPIEIVPMWLAEVEILSIEKAAKPFDKKGKMILAIHSPARLFMEPAEDVPGKQYSFTVFGTLKDESPDYYGAEAKEVKRPKGKEP